MLYSFWHGPTVTASDEALFERSLNELRSNSLTSTVYVDGSGWDEPGSLRESAAKRLFQHLSNNISANYFVFQNARLAESTHKEFSHAMSQNKGLHFLNIRNLSSGGELYAVPTSLFSNMNLRSISLSKVALNTEACERLGRLIEESEVLHSLNLDTIRGIETEGLKLILEGISTARSLTTFKLRNVEEFEKEKIKQITQALSLNRSIRNVCLEGLNMDSENASDIAKMICCNTAIQSLSLRQNQLDDRAAEILVSQGLLRNTCLEGLLLGRNPLGNSSAPHIARLLRENNSIRQLCLVNTNLMDDGCIRVVEALAHNTKLRSISLDMNSVENCGEALLASLNHNTTIQSVVERMKSFLNRCGTESNKKTWKKVEFFLRANKANRRFLYRQPGQSLPAVAELEDVPFFLEGAGIQKDVFFDFLRHSVHHFQSQMVTTTPVRKSHPIDHFLCISKFSALSKIQEEAIVNQKVRLRSAMATHPKGSGLRQFCSPVA